MNMFKREKQPTMSSATLRSKIEQFRTDLRAAEHQLKVAREARGEAFAAPADQRAAADNTVLQLEKKIEVLKDYIVGGEKQWTESRLAEAKAAYVPEWLALRERYLRVHALALEIESALNAAHDAVIKLSGHQSVLQSAGIKCPSRPLSEAIRINRDGDAEVVMSESDRKMRGARRQDLPHGIFIAGRTYSGSVACDVFSAMASPDFPDLLNAVSEK